MKEEMQKAMQFGYSRRDRTESERIDDAKATSIILNEGAQTFIEIIGERLVEVQPSTLNLLEQILGSHNLNEAYRQVVRNGGAGGVDKMETSEQLPYLNLHKDELLGGLCLHPKSRDKFRRTLKQITSRSNGKGYKWLKECLTRYVRGWVTYYRLADMKSSIVEINKWYHRRLRMYIWKSWKRIRTKYANLQRCGISKFYAWQWANTRKGYWHTAGSPILSRAMTIEKLSTTGYPNIMNYYTKLHRK